MLLKQDFVNKIKDYFDLNQYETKIWLALLAKGVASAGEVAELSGVPRSRAYDVLETLEKKGFALIKLGKPVKYIGVKPATILEKIKNNIKKDTHERITSLSNIQSTDEFSFLESLYTEGIDSVKREDISASLKGRITISNHLKESIERANEELIVCLSAEDFASKMKIFAETFGRLKRSKLKIRIALHGDENLIKSIQTKLRIKIAKVDFRTKFFIVDRKEILFYVSSGEEEDMAIWINSDFFANSFATLFEQASRE